MDGFEKEIWEQLIPAETDPVSRPAHARKKKGDPPGADHWPNPILLERAGYLRRLAKAGDGQASETLQQYPGHAVMLSFRARSGVVELHGNFADLFCVLDGRATLLTGGTVVGAETIAPGEIRGTSIEGGVRQELRPGDVAHVPAGVPHQILVPGEKTFSSLVVKIEQSS
jgi:mannose-6-phosphate isomerase-like protein (cupin superfamily)